ncbi:MAG: hypothetical protein J5634_04170 [Bacilli bacterium]|nr:hypothetical protein [Bacilli bacterium]
MKETLLSFGDIIWCDRSHDGIEIRDENHKYGPYIVIEDNDDFVYAIYGCGYTSDKIVYQSTFIIEPIRGTGIDLLRKKTMFPTNQIIKMQKKSIKSYIGRISEKQIEILKRKMIRNDEFVPGCNSMLKKKPEIIFKNGDMFLFNNCSYIVVDDSNNKFNIVIPYSFNGSKTVFNLDKPKKFAKKSDGFKYTKTLDAKKYETINNMYLSVLINSSVGHNEDVKIEPGNIMISNGIIYYVSTIESGNYLCYKLIQTKANEDIIINDLLFNIDFDQVKVNINEKNTYFVSKISEVEIEKIRKLKKERKRIKKKQATSENKSLDKSKERALFGRILGIKKLPNVRVGAYRYENNYYLEVVDLDWLKQGRFITRTYRIDEIIPISSGHSEFVSLIESITVQINDRRYLEFLRTNGIYDHNKVINAPTRKRKPNQKRNDN